MPVYDSDESSYLRNANIAWFMSVLLKTLSETRRLKSSTVRPVTVLKRSGSILVIVAYWLGFYDLGTEKPYGRFPRRKRIPEILGLLRAIRRQFPDEHLYVIWHNRNAHRSRKVTRWANANQVGLAFTPNCASWLDPIECQSGELDAFVIEGSDFESHPEAAAAIRHYMRDRNKRATHRFAIPSTSTLPACGLTQSPLSS